MAAFTYLSIFKTKWMIWTVCQEVSHSLNLLPKAFQRECHGPLTVSQFPKPSAVPPWGLTSSPTLLSFLSYSLHSPWRCHSILPSSISFPWNAPNLKLINLLCPQQHSQEANAPAGPGAVSHIQIQVGLLFIAQLLSVFFFFLKNNKEFKPSDD